MWELVGTFPYQNQTFFSTGSHCAWGFNIRDRFIGSRYCAANNFMLECRWSWKTVFPLYSVICPLAWLNLLYLERGEYSYRMDQRTGLACSTVHGLYWDLHSRQNRNHLIFKKGREYGLKPFLSWQELN